ncbi:hypothetical protein DDZ13_01860 [Coraliomargarita sinensis]|uniref:Type II secretion system protein GspG C-terminal domain-containing protein n=1 Tax=Coraliomargarita sinensis TaxID=2174842 RepID=A0A317ZIV0_9BACT|nr:hypothetical protein [Coraliomargarita sinensis]PXA05644.1 hypothetical protein DDZ13_01860 [Coraliomargarita sinensis]
MKTSKIAIIAAVFLVCLYAFLKSVAFPIILETHTAFLFLQIEEALEEEEHAPVTVEEFMHIIRASELDWNSCKIEDSQIWDSWGQAIRVESHEGEWTLHSPGRNGLFGDSDDIIQTTKKTGPREAATPSSDKAGLVLSPPDIDHTHTWKSSSTKD